MIRVTAFGAYRTTPEFWALPASGRIAVIAHEAGHKYHKHLARRWLANWLLGDAALRAMYHAQEYEADRYAAGMGYGRELAAVLALQPHDETITHPATRARIARLIGSVIQ